MLIANLTHNFFDQVFDGDEASHAPVFVNHDGHANVVLLHLAQKVAAPLALGHEVNVLTHERVHGAGTGFGVRNLQHILGVDEMPLML